MTDSVAAQAAGQDRPPSERLQDFIFSRELAEVYLLLDFVSGRSDKSLAGAFADLDPQPQSPAATAVAAAAAVSGTRAPQPFAGQRFIERICQIPWPPKDAQQPQLNAEAAATLMLAKDRLNFAARPANGATVAFSLLVAGDDVDRTGDKVAGDRSGGPRGAGLDAWKADVPSRNSLARHAFPGMVASARCFRRYNRLMIVFMLFWLLLTCALSWSVATGHSIVSRLDSVKTAVADTKRKILAEEEKLSGLTAPTGAAADVATIGTPLGGAPSVALAAAGGDGKTRYVQRYCERARALPKAGATAQFETAAQYHICDELDANLITLRTVRAELGQWVESWRVVPGLIEIFCGSGPCRGSYFASASERLPRERADFPEESVAAVLLDVSVGAVLPILYGILGAGAAAIRGISAKMRDSLLSPRDFILSLGQLASGAVIGACIGLFVPASNASVAQGAGFLTGPVALSASALSFIAGFGVESVFQALESLIKRLFNTEKTVHS